MTSAKLETAVSKASELPEAQQDWLADRIHRYVDLRAEIAKGLDDIDARRTEPAEDVLADYKKRYPVQNG